VTAILAALVAEATEVPPGINDLAKYGPLGAICLALLWFAWWVVRNDRARAETHAQESWQREIQRSDRLEADNKRLNEFIQDKAIPALLAGATAVTEATELLREERRGRRRRDGGDA
jgi:hypothetical protein